MNTHKNISPDIFNTSFIDDSRIIVTGYESEEVNGEYKVEVKELGEITLSSGKIIFCDTISNSVDTKKPFTQKVTPGSYKVQMSLLKKDSIYRVGFSRVVFEDTEAGFYDIALCESDDISTLKQSEILGTGVDGGTAGYLDENIKHAYNDLINSSFDEIFSELEKSADSLSRSFADITVNKESGENVIMTSTGYGDGMYASYFGYKDNEAVSLLSDFYMIPWNLEACTVTCK